MGLQSKPLQSILSSLDTFPFTPELNFWIVSASRVADAAG